MRRAGGRRVSAADRRLRWLGVELLRARRLLRRVRLRIGRLERLLRVGAKAE